MKRNNSTQMAGLIFPVHGCRDEMRRKGKQPKNHHKGNLEYLKELQKVKKPEMKPAVRAKSVSPDGVDYITENITYVKSLKVPKFEEPSEISSCLETLGKVPKYLETIKKTLENNSKKQ